MLYPKLKLGIIKMTMNYIRLDTNKTTKIKKTLYSWFKDYNPQYFLSIQFPKYRRSINLEKNETNLHQIMSTVEKMLLGRHWNRKHIPFIAVAEHGKSVNWHYHILIYNCPFNFFEIQSVIQNVSSRLNLPPEVLHIEPVNDEGGCSYPTKEFKSNINYHIDSDRIITSEYLFDLSRKSQTHIPQSQNQVQNHGN